MSEPISGDHDLVYEIHRAAQRYGANQPALVAAYREDHVWGVAANAQYRDGGAGITLMLQAVADAIAKLRSGT